MEYQVERYKFRLRRHKRTADYHGRILIDEDKLHSLQIWMTNVHNAKIRLEVAPVKQRKKLWQLFQALCEARGTEPLEYIDIDEVGAAWKPVPETKARAPK